MISYCGLNCETCPIHLATLEKDRSRQYEMRREIAGICNKKYKMRMKPEDVGDCDGCTADTGRLFSGSAGCEVRACARERGFRNCAYCPDYVCNFLGKIHAGDPEARKRLDDVRSSFSS